MDHKTPRYRAINGQRTIRLVVAGGGTGGHVFPGIAVVEAMESCAPMEVLWIGTGRSVEKDALAGHRWDYRVLDVMPIKGTGLMGTIRSLSGLPLSLVKAISWLRSFRPHVVFGVGGYVSGPVLLAARILGIPTALHEQNLIPGLTNRLGSRFVKQIFVSFKGTTRYFPKKKVILTGNPIRRSIIQSPGHQAGKFHHLLVLGGSQGAKCLNRLVGTAIQVLWQSDVPLKIRHQTGQLDLSYMKKFYGDADIPADVTPFISDMGESYSWADLVVCRAGAGTLAELTALGRPSILIPYPLATDGHQEANARELAEAGAAKCFREGEIGAMKLAGEIQSLL
ncbi:MAG: undecaprenyldiphospho-muramoylpentapeptide beta-N-acetylglucosaminyltransferase, partial [Nitrospiraceae bacterium]|nr:undecaprenyldiphospho-muramoylpentapeptide beta-N-acetylglucosaminyltransferase [Nitrospiraceae bacterium]